MTEREPQAREMDWQNAGDVKRWVERQLVSPTRNMDCFDERDVLDPNSAESQSLTVHPLFVETKIDQVAEDPGALKFPGADAGMAALIHLTTGAEADAAFTLALEFAVAQRRLFTTHTDTAHITEDSIRGCGLMALLANEAEVLGIDPRTGQRIISRVNDLHVAGKPAQVAVYKGGDHKPKAWIDSTLTDHSIRQTSKDGNVFVNEPGRVRALFDEPETGLTAFLQKRGHSTTSDELMDRYNGIVDVLAPRLAPGAPRYTVGKTSQGFIEVRRTGTLPPRQ